MLNKTPTTPKDAAAVVMLRAGASPHRPEIYWVRRSEKLRFLGGYHAFPGGQLDPSDVEAPVENSKEPQKSAMIGCAARELFEETGVLIVKGAEKLTKGQRATLRDDLLSRRMSFPELLEHYDLDLDARDWTFVGRWVTPPFSPRRYDTWFFMVDCPMRQEPEIDAEGELDTGEWIPAPDAVARWNNSEVLMAPPVLHALRTLSGGCDDNLVRRFLAVHEAHGEPVRRIEFRPGFICFPVRTPTKPPATHTNCYIIGTKEVVILDPGSPYEEEQQALGECIDDLVSEGRIVREIILTHLHPDHVGGVKALTSHLGKHVPVAAHALTAEALRGAIEIDRLIKDKDTIDLVGEPPMTLRAMHTPGHARGHLCFYEEQTGSLVAGDNIVGLGSVLIARPEGNMRDYLVSLDKMSALPNLSVLFGGHGPAVANPRQKIAQYRDHRLERERNILNAVRAGASTPEEIVARVYTDVNDQALGLAEEAVMAHLEKLVEDKLVTQVDKMQFSAVHAPADQKVN